MAVERYEFKVCPNCGYNEGGEVGLGCCRKCGIPDEPITVSAVPVCDYDRLLSGVREEIDNLDDLCRLYLKDEGSTAEELARASDRLEAVIQSCLEEGR